MSCSFREESEDPLTRSNLSSRTSSFTRTANMVSMMYEPVQQRELHLAPFCRMSSRALVSLSVPKMPASSTISYPFLWQSFGYQAVIFPSEYRASVMDKIKDKNSATCVTNKGAENKRLSCSLHLYFLLGKVPDMTLSIISCLRTVDAVPKRWEDK